MPKSINAVGEYVIVVSTPKQQGDEIRSEGGLFLGQVGQSELPEYLTVYSIGPDVPPGLLQIGDITSMPPGVGNMRNVPHPDVIEGHKEPNEIREKYTSIHWKAFSTVYREE